MVNNESLEESIVKEITSVSWRAGGSKSRASFLLAELKKEWASELVEIIETKLRNDPNSVYIAGFDYVLTLLQR